VSAVQGPLRDWLAACREALNARFRQARRRFPRLDGDAVLALCAELLPPLAGDDTGRSAALLDAVFDLILLHAGRGHLAPVGAGGGRPGLRRLLADAFPRLRPLLLARPRHLPGALSNAVENLGPRGVDFAAALAGLAAVVTSPDELLDAGAVLAWRLGDARLRGGALDAAKRLPPRAALDALGLPALPAEAAPAVLAGLAADGWSPPGQTPAAPAAGWRLAARVGEFVGFGGDFEGPPRLLDAGGQETRHRFWVSSGGVNYRLDADVFGWVCRPDPGAAGWPPREGRRRGLAEVPAGATSTLELPGLIAFTRPDSFRVRVLTPAREPL
jgi:hypothetical protein